jgi:hypothetical protein
VASNLLCALVMKSCAFSFAVVAVLLSSSNARADGSIFDSVINVANQLKNRVQNAVGGSPRPCPAPIVDRSSPVGEFASPSPSPVSSPSPDLSVAASPTPAQDPVPAGCGFGGGDVNDMVTGVLLQEGFDPAQEKSPASCLVWALDHGAILNGTDPKLRPLFLAVSLGYPELAKILIQRGADPNTTDDLGVTVLAVAASEMQDEVLDALLAHGADPNKPDLKGKDNGALFGAVAVADLHAVSALLSHGAKPNSVTDFGDDRLSPLDESANDIGTLKIAADTPGLTERILARHAPSNTTPRPLDQMMSDAQKINALLKASGATCITDPCGGLLGKVDADLDEARRVVEPSQP